MYTTTPDELPKVSIHAPREGCDPFALSITCAMVSFNSRTPGGVRLQVKLYLLVKVGFNSRTPGGVRLAHSPSDVDALRLFQFTHPGRGATSKSYQDIGNKDVSIHAPREGCDLLSLRISAMIWTFQFTHPGRGATTFYPSYKSFGNKFQFTHPGRGATEFSLYGCFAPRFQFTHPGRGATHP